MEKEEEEERAASSLGRSRSLCSTVVTTWTTERERVKSFAPPESHESPLRATLHQLTRDMLLCN